MLSLSASLPFASNAATLSFTLTLPVAGFRPPLRDKASLSS